MRPSPFEWQIKDTNTDRLEAYRQLVIEKTIDAAKTDALVRICTDVEAEDDAQDVFRAFLTYVLLSHWDKQLEFTWYEAHSGRLKSNIVEPCS